MLGQYLGAGSATTKLLLHLNGNSTDSSGNGNNGTDTNITYSQANGRFGMGAGFNGSSSYINVSTNLYALTDFTISAWIKTTDTGNKEIYEQKNTADNADLDFSINLGKLNLSNYNGSTSPTVTSNASINDGNWHHVVGTRSGSTIKVYIDGRYDNQNTSGNTVTVGINTGQVGRHPSGGTTYLNGSIDEVIVENIAWTPQQVAKYYSYAKGRFGII
jgi:hypothetical protein